MTTYTSTQFKIGQTVQYTNGSLSIYEGEIVKITPTSLVVIDCEAGMELHRSGCANGSEIAFSQVKQVKI